MLDLNKPINQYGRTPFMVGALLCFVGALLAFCVRKPEADSTAENILTGAGV
jgi:ABC-type Fe3+-siderophore transport system permease subunit